MNSDLRRETGFWDGDFPFPQVRKIHVPFNDEKSDRESSSGQFFAEKPLLFLFHELNISWNGLMATEFAQEKAVEPEKVTGKIIVNRLILNGASLLTVSPDHRKTLRIEFAIRRKDLPNPHVCIE